jgi:hypothetical protein
MNILSVSGKGKKLSQFIGFCLVLGILAGSLSGCISIPPLVSVTHKHEARNESSEDQLLRKLEAMERRLEAMERKIDVQAGR